MSEEINTSVDSGGASGAANTESKQENKTAPTAALIPIDSEGRVIARNNSELLRYCGALVHGEGVPKRFDTPQKLFAALMFVRDLRLPDTAIRQVANIHGVMSAFGDIPLALAQRSKDWGSIQEQWFDAEYKPVCFQNKNLTAEVVGAVCWLSRGTGNAQSFSFTIDEAKAAGLYPGKESMPWFKYTNLMLRYRARSMALKSLYADCINGLAIGEYDFDSIVDSDSVHVGSMREVGGADKSKEFRDDLRSEGVSNGT
jgi:hypothetical protein